MVGHFFVVIFISVIALSTHGFIQTNLAKSNKYGRTISKHRLNTALPLPTQLVSGALRNTLFGKAKISTLPIFFYIKNVSVGWKAFVLMVAALVTRAKAKLKKEVKKAANQMENGWSRRGYNGSFRRTLEVWLFSVSFLFKFVSLFCILSITAIILSRFNPFP